MSGTPTIRQTHHCTVIRIDQTHIDPATIQLTLPEPHKLLVAFSVHAADTPVQVCYQFALLQRALKDSTSATLVASLSKFSKPGTSPWATWPQVPLITATASDTNLIVACPKPSVPDADHDYSGIAWHCERADVNSVLDTSPWSIQWFTSWATLDAHVNRLFAETDAWSQQIRSIQSLKPVSATPNEAIFKIQTHPPDHAIAQATADNTAN